MHYVYHSMCCCFLCSIVEKNQYHHKLESFLVYPVIVAALLIFISVKCRFSVFVLNNKSGFYMTVLQKKPYRPL